MKLQASAPNLSQSSSGPDSWPASPQASRPGSAAAAALPEPPSMFWTIDTRSGFGFTSCICTAENIGFLLLRRRASLRMPVRAAGTAMRCSRAATASPAAGGRGDAVAMAAWGLEGTAPVGGM